MTEGFWLPRRKKKMRDFHIYPHGDGSISLVFDQKDPELIDILNSMGDIFNDAQRPRESDECRNMASNLESHLSDES